MKILKQKILTWEYAYAVLFFISLLYPDTISPTTSLIIFCIITFLKYHTEGFRLNFPLFVISEALAYYIDFAYIKLLSLGITVFAIWYFPIFSFPKPSGHFFCGYKTLNFAGGNVASVFYPTDQFTDTVPYETNGNSWRKFYLVQRLFGDKPRSWIYRIALNFMKHIEMAVNNDARIISKAQMSHNKKLPVIIFSHGLAGNRNIHATILRNWAIHGYLVFAIEHTEQIDVPLTMCLSDMQKLRFDQVLQRRDQIKLLLDYICSKKNLSQFFDEDIEIDESKISIAGYAFGAASAAYTALHEKRITGVCILLDPWLFPIMHQIKDQQLNKPTLIIRSIGFEKQMEHVYKNKENCIEFLKKNNSEFLRQSMSCTFEGSTHVGLTDLIYYIPRELTLAKLFNKVKNVENFVIYHNGLTEIFLDTMLNEGENGTRGTIDTVLRRFKNYVAKKKKPDVFIKDNLT